MIGAVVNNADVDARALFCTSLQGSTLRGKHTQGNFDVKPVIRMKMRRPRANVPQSSQQLCYQNQTSLLSLKIPVHQGIRTKQMFDRLLAQSISIVAAKLGCWLEASAEATLQGKATRLDMPH